MKTEQLATYTVTTSSGAQFKIPMRLIESKKQYGRVDWLCTPVSGEGEIWLSEGSLEMRPNEVLGLDGEEHEYVPQTEEAYVRPEGETE